MIPVVKPLEQVYAFAMPIPKSVSLSRPGVGNGILYVRRIPRLQRLEYSDLDLGGITILGYGTDNLDGDLGLCQGIRGFHDLAERALPKKLGDTI